MSAFQKTMFAFSLDVETHNGNMFVESQNLCNIAIISPDCLKCNAKTCQNFGTARRDEKSRYLHTSQNPHIMDTY